MAAPISLGMSLPSLKSKRKKEDEWWKFRSFLNLHGISFESTAVCNWRLILKNPLNSCWDYESVCLSGAICQLIPDLKGPSSTLISFEDLEVDRDSIHSSSMPVCPLPFPDRSSLPLVLRSGKDGTCLTEKKRQGECFQQSSADTRLLFESEDCWEGPPRRSDFLSFFGEINLRGIGPDRWLAGKLIRYSPFPLNELWLTSERDSTSSFSRTIDKRFEACDSNLDQSSRNRCRLSNRFQGEQSMGQHERPLGPIGRLVKWNER